MSETDNPYSIDARQDESTVSLLTWADRDPWTMSATRSPISGRSRETLMLLKSYHRVVTSNNVIVAIVHGVSGVGKTALVDDLRETVCDSGGFFCSGKFFQNAEVHEPYSAIMMAFSDLCDLVSQSDDFDDNRRREIQKSLGNECSVLSRAITNLSSVIVGAATGSGTLSDDIRGDVAYSKFKAACTRFLHAMSSHKHPIVIFIDDVQWMDEGSIDLINAMLNDAELANVFMILTYRDEEADKVKALSLSDVATDCIVDIQIDRLDQNAVHQILSISLGSNLAETYELSELVWQKTAGNPFHVHQLMNDLEREGLIRHKHTCTSLTYVFNVETIRKHVIMIDSAAELLTRKAARLDPKVRDILGVASLLGNRFDEATLMGICSESAVQQRTGNIEDHSSVSPTIAEFVQSSLFTAEQQGFLERVRGQYQFCHDKIQKCFQSMMADDESSKIHKMIGEWFVSQGNKSLYRAANHLHQSLGIPRCKQDRLNLIKLDFEASKYCREKSAFIDEARVLRLAYQALDIYGSWSEEPALTFEVTLSLAKAELVVSNFDSCEALIRQALLHCKDLRLRIKLLLVEIERQETTMQVAAAIGTVRNSLKLLGVQLPRGISILHVVRKLFRVKRMMRNKSSDEILAMPILEDELQNSTVKLLFDCGSLHSVRNENTQSIYYSLLAVEFTLKYGLSPCSAPAFAMYAMLEAALGNQAYAYDLGSTALTMSDKMESCDAKCTTLLFVKCLIAHWCETLNSLESSCDLAMNLAFDGGCVPIASFAWANCAGMRCYTGKNFVDVESFHRLAAKRARTIGQVSLFHWITPYFQYTLNMQMQKDDWYDVLTLNGEAMMEDEYITFSLRANNSHLLSQFWLLKLHMAYFFGYYKIAATFALNVATYGNTGRGHFNTYQWYYLTSAVGYELYRSTGKRRHLGTARKYHRALSKLKQSPNVPPLLCTLFAEELASKRTSTQSEVTNAYTEAIRAMSGLNLFHMEGLLNERLGFYLIRLGKDDNGIAYLDRAMRLYQDNWGSTAKYESLRERRASEMQRSSHNCIPFEYQQADAINSELKM